MYTSCTIYEIFCTNIVREIGIHVREKSGNCQGILFCPVCGNPDKGTDRTARMNRLFCAFVVRIWHKQVFSCGVSYVRFLVCFIMHNLMISRTIISRPYATMHFAHSSDRFTKRRMTFATCTCRRKTTMLLFKACESKSSDPSALLFFIQHFVYYCHCFESDF